uniref:Uncharacterized protein n=1 Tax=Candidatus Kentrum eta TaxID=2126337 RepID=A0A450UD73_9GAMM|nr:MAG: hypothetical protein BECKH772A_GA0070896_100113 [Candidatus Kentron sp. H]VFJ90327.1 MAG: hypothetical protein BECKH772B_GA0070898_100095 [Candidatus Kentron sp. H]VFJ97001.1 MAG: hypothetical protein BECKH772C_GA0070978_100103 [Candidatus Kentron sp. H]
MSKSDARQWLRDNGYVDVADTIDALMDDWRQQGKKTRRNWWDVLAGGVFPGNSPKSWGNAASPQLGFHTSGPP